MTERIVVHFSCGTASAVALKLILDEKRAAMRRGEPDLSYIHAINAFIADEDDDNRRFLADVERWLGITVEVFRDEKYGASPLQVWIKRRFIVGQHGAPCSKLLKRDVLDKYWRPGDVDVFGYTADPRDAERFDRWIDAHGDRKARAPLIEQGLTKEDCLRIIHEAGIELPLMNRLGCPNANCPECPHGGMGYWNRIRVTHPQNFEKVACVQDVLGPGSYFFRDRKSGERISLRMLDPNAGRFEPIELPDCTGACEITEPQLSLFANL